jgi:hypothetical protein
MPPGATTPPPKSFVVAERVLSRDEPEDQPRGVVVSDTISARTPALVEIYVISLYYSFKGFIFSLNVPH